MDSNSFATKRNLIEATKNLYLAEKGHDLLDRKRQVLLHELNEAKRVSGKLKEKLNITIKKATQILIVARMDVGELPVTPINLEEGTTATDEAYLSMQEVQLIFESTSRAEAKVKQLTKEMQKAQKRALALKNITIPTLKTRIKYIRDQLEEKDRDELVRVKQAANFH